MKKSKEKDDHSYPSKWDQELFEAVLKLKTKDEAAKFFRDLLTIAEIKEFSKRWQIAKLLDQGLPYQQVAEKAGCSTTTVTRVAHWLNNGMGGYRLLLKRIKRN